MRQKTRQRCQSIMRWEYENKTNNCIITNKTHPIYHHHLSITINLYSYSYVAKSWDTKKFLIIDFVFDSTIARQPSTKKIWIKIGHRSSLWINLIAYELLKLVNIHGCVYKVNNSIDIYHYYFKTKYDIHNISTKSSQSCTIQNDERIIRSVNLLHSNTWFHIKISNDYYQQNIFISHRFRLYHYIYYHELCHLICATRK